MLAVITGASSAEQRTVSAGDCTFASRPNDFMAREARVRRDISVTALKLNRIGPRAIAAPRAAGEIPHRNFIDDYIFDAMTAQRVLSARLTTDEEFFRRINLDLIGRIPDPDAVRTFVSDTTSTKRDDLIERLLASPEFVHRWTMWLGDLLQNTAASANVSRQIGGRDAFFWWIKLAVNAGTSLTDIAYQTIVAQGNTFDYNVGATNFVYGMTTPMGPIQDTYDTFLSKTAQTYLGIAYYDCLLCHNGRGHLDSISLWGSGVTRAEAWQMAAFFARVRMTLNPQPNGQPLYLSEEIGDAATGTYGLNTNYGNRPNRTPVGTVKILTPVYRDGQVPADNQGTWRDAYARFATTDAMFARNFANRLWRFFFRNSG
jgi:hypothetical protein